MRNLKKKFTVLIIILLLLTLFGLAFNLVFPYRYSGAVKDYANEYGLPVELVFGVIHTESRFRPEVRSPRDAVGLMQLTKGTADWGAQEIGLNDYDFSRITEPNLNILIGCWYLNRLIEQYGNINTALAAYNAGSGNVSKWLADPNYSSDGKALDALPFPETEEYVKRVNRAAIVYKILSMVR